MMVRVICSLHETCAFAYEKCPHGHVHDENPACETVCKVGKDLFGEESSCVEA